VVTVQLEHSFTVPVGIDDAWDVLVDVERVVPCIPGATVTSVHGDEFVGTVNIRLGPVAVAYTVDAVFQEKDFDARRVVVEATGHDPLGVGSVTATMTTTLHPEGERLTRVDLRTQFEVAGLPPQLMVGRYLLADMGGRLVGQFADCLAATIGGRGAKAASWAAPAGGTTAGGTAAPGAPRPGGVREWVRQRPRGRAGDAIDLLETSGVTERIRRYGPLVAAFAAGSAAVWLLSRRRHRG